MEETIIETTAPAIVSEAENVMEAVSSGTVDSTVLKSFYDALIAYLPTVVTAIIIYIAGKIIAKILLHIIDKAMGRSRIDETAQGFLRSLIGIIFTAFVIVITLSTLGIPMTSIITTIGAAGVAVALALQNSLSNVAGGFLILMNKPFVKGDFISTNGNEGTVEDISILSTKLLTVDNKVIYIPNSMISGNTLINYSREEKRRVDLKFSIAYEEDFKEAIKIISGVIAEHKLILSEDAPFVRVSDLSASSVDITVRVWTKTPDYWTVYFDLIEQVKSAFDQNGIEIPYSKLDVNLKDKASKAV
ncbi:mechanosensitive ion channel family protein [Huintestinicola sp.]|uniref:mechanosensitive ion channel family protein n=1 Tax=Huintestinicola sp. TaxID=2981661 RepID=UPI003D7E7930